MSDVLVLYYSSYGHISISHAAGSDVKSAGKEA